MELYILSKQDLSILSICKLADYQINLDEETNAKSTFTLMKTNGLKKGNYMTLNGLYRQFIFVIDDVQTEKSSDVATVTALDISNIFDRKVIEKNIDTMKSKSIEEFLANTISENFVNSDDTALNVNYIEIYWHTNTQGNVATNAENGLYNFHTFLINCRQYKNIYTDFKLENLGNPKTVEGKRISAEARNRKIVDISLHGESTQKTRSGKNICPMSGFNTMSSNGVSNTYDNSTHTITMDVDATGASGRYCKPVTNLEIGKTYTISFDIRGTSGKKVECGWNDARKTITLEENFVRYSSSLIATITSEPVVFYSKALANGGLASDEYMQFANVQIEEGDTATDYEEYGVMPSPDYPSEIENVEGNIEFKVEGKNRFDKEASYIFKTNNVDKIVLDTGVRIQSTATYTTNATNFYVVKLGNITDYLGKTIRIKTTALLSSDTLKAMFYLGTCTDDGTSRKSMKTGTLAKGVSGEIFVSTTISSEQGDMYDNLMIALYSTGGTPISSGDYIDYNELIVTADDEDMTYEPYKSQVETFPLGGEKLMEGSYLADDGIHHKRKQVVFDGSDDEGWTSYSTKNGLAYMIDILNIKQIISTTVIADLYCDYYTKTSQGAIYAETVDYGISKRVNQPQIIIRNKDILTLAEWKAWLAEHPITLEYDLAEPEIVPYTEEQQTVWDKIKNLTLFEGVNHISSKANMVLKYYPLKAVGLKFVLRIDIENKQETTELIDTTLPEVTDYNKIYEEDVTAKVQVYIREDGSEYNLYLKTDRTTTTNKDDPDRANGKIEVISVDTADKAAEEALNVMKGNNYKHLVEFKIAKTSKLMDITKLHIRKTYKNQNRRRYI